MRTALLVNVSAAEAEGCTGSRQTGRTCRYGAARRTARSSRRAARGQTGRRGREADGRSIVVNRFSFASRLPLPVLRLDDDEDEDEDEDEDDFEKDDDEEDDEDDDEEEDEEEEQETWQVGVYQKTAKCGFPLDFGNRTA